jgi:metal-sulfur cluster biosynthetic enzyme
MNIISNNNLKCTVALAALQNVIDPEIGLNIVDLGLVYQLDFDETIMEIFCTLTLTTRFCPMGESISDATKQALKSTFSAYKITIELTFDPPWNNEMISDEGRVFLNQK